MTTLRHWKWVFLAVIFYVASDVSIRLAAAEVNFISGGIVQGIPLLIICGIGLVFNDGIQITYKKRGTVWLILAYGAVQILFGNMLYFLAMRFGGLSIASPTVQSQAVWAVILGAVLLKEKIAVNGWVGIICFSVGISLITYFKSQGGVIAPNWQWGGLFGIMGGLSWASGSVIQKVLLRNKVSLNTMLFWGTLFGMILLAVLGFSIDAKGFLTSFTDFNTYKMLPPGIFCSIAVMSLACALRYIAVSTVIPVLSVSIIINTILGVVFWHEYVSPGTVSGLLIAFTGILISQNMRLNQKNKES